MKVAAIIRIIDTYNAYQRKIGALKQELIVDDAFDDDSAKQETKRKIKIVQDELGRFLDMEV